MPLNGLYIGNMETGVTNEVLYAWIDKIATPRIARVIRDPINKESRGILIIFKFKVLVSFTLMRLKMLRKFKINSIINPF
jgi:hypothetical protein